MTKPDAPQGGNADDTDASESIDLRETAVQTPARPVSRAHVDDELDDYNAGEKTAGVDEWIGWNGRSSKIALAYPIMRDFEIVGPGSPCIDCKRIGKKDVTSHQFHIRASKEGQNWFGPESDHFRVLLSLGVIAGSPQADERRGLQSAVDYQRGVRPSDTCTACGTPIERNADGTFKPLCPNNHRNGLPELAAMTTEQQQRIWRRDLAAGPAEARRRERQLVGADSVDLKSGQLALANAMRLAMGQQPLTELPENVGPTAPGTARVSE